MKKLIFLFFAAILCAIGMNAATPTKIYLNAQDWGYGDARYAAYFFDPAMWVDMKKVDGETFIYEVDVPAGYTKVILCRMNGGTTENNWDNRWNQTGDLTIPTDGKNMFKPDDWNGQTTTWSTYTPTVTHTFAKNSTLYVDFRAITDKKGANYPKAGSVGIDYSANAGGTVIPVTFTADVKWTEGAEFMKTEKGDWASIPFKAPEAGQNCAQVAADGKSYTWTTYSEPSVTLSLDKTEADAGTNVTVTLTATADNVSGEVTYAFQYSTDNVTWNDITATGNTATQTFAAETRYYKVTMTNGGNTKEATAKFSAIKFHVIGSWDDWTTHNATVDGNVTLSLVADSTYEFKISSGTWDYSWGNDGTMTRDNCTDWSFESNGNAKITTDIAGDYVFNVSRNDEGKVKVSVTYPVPTYDVTTTATVSTQGQNIVLSGSWEEKALTVMLWQGGATQGFGTYAAEDYAPIFLGAAELTPTSEGVYADNSDGTFTFTATATDSEGAIYNITLTGDNPVVEPEYKEWEGSVLFTEEEGTLSISYAASDWSWFLELYIENYTGHSTYEVANVYYGDETVEYYDMYGTVTVEYADWAGTDVLYADLTSGDGTLKVWATLYNEEPVAAAEYDVVITNATVTENTFGYYIDMTGEWDGHTIKVEVCDELTADNILANFFIDGGIVSGGNQAEGTVEATVSGGIVTITGTFECMGTGVYHVTISGTLPDNLTTAVDNLNATVALVKMIKNGQLVIIKNGVQFNAQGAVVK